jgi:hypothetical protein
MIKHAATRLFLTLMLVAGASVPARATIITFDGLAGTAMPGNSQVFTTFTKFSPSTVATVDGFQFSSSGREFFLGAAYTAACCNSDLGDLAYNGTDYLIGEPDITVSKVGGGAFSLNGFDLAEWDNTFTASIKLTTAGPGGPTTEVLPLSILGNKFKTVGNDFTHFSLTGYDNVVSFTLVGNVSWAFIAMDNLDVAAPIPEPETYAMLLAGLGLLGIASRRRKQNEAGTA